MLIEISYTFAEPLPGSTLSTAVQVDERTSPGIQRYGTASIWSPIFLPLEGVLNETVENVLEMDVD